MEQEITAEFLTRLDVALLPLVRISADEVKIGDLQVPALLVIVKENDNIEQIMSGNTGEQLTKLSDEVTKHIIIVNGGDNDEACGLGIPDNS
jgi:hypothetical protein